MAITYLTIVKDLGLGAALVQRREDVERAANTVFTLNLLVGIAVSLLTVAIAPLVAVYFREPQVTPMLRWLALSIFLNSLGSVHNARLQRELNFKWKIIPSLGNTITKAIVSIGLALLNFGAWSLIFGQIAGSAVSLILVWIVMPWRPRLTIERAIAGSLFKYGSFIMGENALSVAQDDFDYLIIGRMFSQAAMGVYTLAYQIPEMLVISLLWVISDVIFPAFSSIQDQAANLKRSILQTMRYMGLIVTPICFGLIVAADPIIRVVFGDQWVDAIPIMRILSVYALVLSTGFNIGDVYKAIGRPDISIKITIPVMVFRIAALIIGAKLGGLVGIACGHLFAAFIEVIIRLTVATRVLDLNFGDFARQMTGLAAGAVLLLTTIPVVYLTGDFTPLPRLLLIVLAGVMGYLTAIWFIERALMTNLVNQVRSRFSSR